MNISKRSIAGLGATGVLLLGAAYPALAQDATEEPTASDEETASDDREARATARADELASALAEELDLSTETVAAALEAVQTRLAEQLEAEHLAALEERLAEAVADGALTQEQADALLAAQEAGVLGDGRGGHGPRGFGGPAFGPDFGPDDDDEADQSDEDATGSAGSATEEASASA